MKRSSSAPVSDLLAEPRNVAPSNSSLRHILLVGGTLTEWAAMSRHEWEHRVDLLGSRCAELGVPWLTVRAYERGQAGDRGGLVQWRRSVGGCEVVVDPSGDGRQRFADAMQHLDLSDEINEASVAAALYEPADCEPDLVVVLGSSTQLPPSLVWELAYAELAFIPVAWRDLAVEDLAAAIADFSSRRRRFGGLDDDE